jgi:hypothetical protein
MRRIKPLDFALPLALALCFLYFFRAVPPSGPYYYDEADYMTAGRAGLIANVTENPSMSIVTFLQTGLNRGMQAKRASLSDIVRGMKDITFYRHYHGPIYYYWLAAIGPLVHNGEYAMRYSGFVFHILTFLAIYFGVLLIASSRIAALVAGSLFLFGQSNIGTDAQITPHIPYVFFTVLTLILFARYLQTGSRTTWYLAVAAFTGAFASIDYAILLPITFAACLILIPARRLPLQTLLRSAGLFLLCLVIIWPLGLIELSAIKGYFYIAYLAMQRKGSYGDDTPLAIWIRRFTDAPVEYSIDALCVALFAVWYLRRRWRPELLPFLIYAFLMLLTTLKNTSLNPTYVSSILPPLAVISGIALAHILEKLAVPLRIAACAALLIGIAAGGYPTVQRSQAANMTRPEEGMMTALREAGLERGSVLVPYEILPTLSFYFPDMHLHPYLKTDDADAVLNKIRDYDVQSMIYSGGLPAAVTRSVRVRFEPIHGAPGFSLFHIDGRL